MSFRIVVLISGKGSNLGAILRAIDEGTCRARVEAVISDREGAPGLALAAERGLPTRVVALRDHADRQAWDGALAAELLRHAPDLVVLAGFMKLLGAAVLSRFPGRIINVHPALLPSFPGHDGPEQALAAGVCVSGCTVHVVDAGVDTGPILAQGAVRVLPSDTVSSLHERIQRTEHALLPRVIDAIASGAIALDAARRSPHGARDDGAMLLSPLLDDAAP